MRASRRVRLWAPALSLADKLTERGARHHPAPNFAAKVVVSERLITGQNPASAKGVGEAMVKLLNRA